MTLADAVNVARRLSVKTGEELLMEDYHVLSQEECEVLASAVGGKISKLPRECKQYVGISRAKAKEDEKVEKAKEDSSAIHHSAFEGMWAGQAASAKAARAAGRESHEKIQRRYTTHTHRPIEKKEKRG